MIPDNKSSLPLELQSKLIFRFNPEDSIEWYAENPEYGDQKDDGKISFKISSQKDKAKYGIVVVEKNGTWKLFSPRQPFNPVELDFDVQTKDASLGVWSRRTEHQLIHPGAPEPIVDKKHQNRLAIAALERFTQHALSQQKDTALYDLLHLPDDHPAKDFIETQLIDWATSNARRIKACLTSNRGLPCLEADVQLEFLAAMKSSRVYYEAGKQLAASIAQPRNMKIVYPAAGANIGALSLGMALIEAKSPQVEMIFTDVKVEVVTDAFSYLKAWADSNPDIVLKNQNPKEEPGREKNGKRYVMELEYRGRPLRLVYAIKDSPPNPNASPHVDGSDDFNISQDYSYHLVDLESLDLMIVHDPQSGKSDILFLKQLQNLQRLEPSQYGGTSFSRQSHWPRAILIADSAKIPDFFLGSHAYQNSDFRASILPWGIKIHGTYAHSADYSLGYRNVKGEDAKLHETGLSLAKDARLIHLQDPILRATIELSACDPQGRWWERMVDFLQMAGGRIVSLKNPPLIGKKSFSIYFPIGPVQASLIWAGKIMPQLEMNQRTRLALLAVRVIYYYSDASSHRHEHQLSQKELLKALPYNLKAAIERVFDEFDLGAKASKDFSARLRSLSNKDLARLQKLLDQ